jgi:N6-L-threonylcarbamoyladenine synthase/protein kinase Bud32
MCEERGAKFFCPAKEFLVDNGAMIAYTGELMFASGIKIFPKDFGKIDIAPRERTDEVEVTWVR